MIIDYYPLWDISIWYNNAIDISSIESYLNNNYNNFLKKYFEKYNFEDNNDVLNQEIIEKNKKLRLTKLSSIEELKKKDEQYILNSNESRIYNYHKEKILNSYKFGLLVEPYLRCQFLFNQKKNFNTFEEYLEHQCLNFKRSIWNLNQLNERPQWYFYSNNTNISFIDTLITILNNSNNNNETIDYKVKGIDTLFNKIYNKCKINEKSVLDINIDEDVKLISNSIMNSFNTEINNIKQLNINNKDLYIKNFNIIKFLYQNDYYFFDKLEYNPKNILNNNLIELRNFYNKSNKQNIYTIITPTVGNTNLLKLKQVLKQEKINYIHLILWDTNRKTMNFNGIKLKPEDLEDECTYCYKFTHPYFRFPNQRNDVWLRGVGITLTNTPYITFFDDDTWPERNHLDSTILHISSNNIDYTYVIRRMWEDSNKLIGPDNFEATGEINKFGYRLIDNSSLYLKLDTARLLIGMFLGNQFYGDDRITYDYLTSMKKKGKRFEKLLVNHIAKEHLIPFFKSNILGS